jgi:hypothetical protein
MQNDYRADDGRLDRSSERPRSEAHPLTDREVPIENARTPAAIHAWLDGELPDSAVQSAELAPHVEFWKRLGADTEQLRQRRTPPHVQARIMAAIAAEPPAGE